MAVLVDKQTRVLTQGLGATGQLHTRLCREYGSQMVAGVAPRPWVRTRVCLSTRTAMSATPPL